MLEALDVKEAIGASYKLASTDSGERLLSRFKLKYADNRLDKHYGLSGLLEEHLSAVNSSVLVAQSLDLQYWIFHGKPIT